MNPEQIREKAKTILRGPILREQELRDAEAAMRVLAGKAERTIYYDRLIVCYIWLKETSFQVGHHRTPREWLARSNALIQMLDDAA